MMKTFPSFVRGSWSSIFISINKKIPDAETSCRFPWCFNRPRLSANVGQFSTVRLTTISMCGQKSVFSIVLFLSHSRVCLAISGLSSVRRMRRLSNTGNTCYRQPSIKDILTRTLLRLMCNSNLLIFNCVVAGR